MEILSRNIPATEEDKALISRFYQYAIQGFMAEWLEGRESQPIERTLRRLHVMFWKNAKDSLQRSVEQPE